MEPSYSWSTCEGITPMGVGTGDGVPIGRSIERSPSWGGRFRVLSHHESSEQEKGPLLHKGGIRRVYAGAPDFGYACALRFTAAFLLLRRWNVVDHPDTLV